MNTATQLGQAKTLRDMYMYTDRIRGPEGYVLAYDHAYLVGKAIAENGNDLYLRAKAAGLTGAKIVLDGYNSKELPLTNKQLDTLKSIIKTLEGLTDDTDKITDFCTKEYKETVPNYNPKNYGL
jgi:methanol--5-hydroxybenzimidazolylcobamide Co-methyltransferase